MPYSILDLRKDPNLENYPQGEPPAATSNDPESPIPLKLIMFCTLHYKGPNLLV